jgi:hypothetical protein
MKLLKHLAIYIFLALNACAGWHDSAPFVAWPATNHLRWVDNVGVYTNASNPTNSGYGAWTNNYYVTNAWTYDYSGIIFTFPYPVKKPFVFGPSVVITNKMLNAKDVRAFDCTLALGERYLVTPPGAASGGISNFFARVSYDPFGSWDSYWLLYRDERLIIEALKKYIHTDIGYGEAGALQYFYYGIPTNATPTNWVAFTEATLCAMAGVPTNFLTYTPHRSADGSWTHYQRILTNTFVLCQGTNAAHVATNSLVDSAGIEFTAVGTNGLTVTRYATNTSQQAGTTLGDYGWDGLRRAISVLNTTVVTPTWGIGSGTNWSSASGSNVLYDWPLSFPTSAGSGQPVNIPADEAINSATNPILPYQFGATLTHDPWQWRLSDTMASNTVFARTNTAPYSLASAMFSFIEYFKSRHSMYTMLGDQYTYNDTTWTVLTGGAGEGKTYSKTNNTDWANYSAPLVTAPVMVNRSVLYYLKTNAVSFLWQSNAVAASLIPYTSSVYRVDQPSAEIEFGFVNNGEVDSGGFLSTWNAANSEYTMISYAFAALSNLTTLANSYGVVSGSTNFPTPTVTIDKEVSVWDFEYK